ncbi:MauE/DoxX family redox-associated membrane protein [Sphingopyxis sp.]|uniref:MauE/DoxX family redox-associated membrane protein n=1 Tax=Sphingopyxis sp. TaxID=1908224 RepID=UPI003D6D5E4C
MVPLIAFADHLFCAAIAAMLAWGAASHLRHWQRFRALVADYRLVPDFAVRPTAGAVVLGEWLAAALILVPGPSRVVGFVFGATLLTALAVAMAINLLRGRRSLSCGCDLFAADRPIAWPLVLRNLLLATLMFAAAGLPRSALDPGAVVLAGSIVLAAIVGRAARHRLSINDRAMEFVR